MKLFKKYKEIFIILFFSFTPLLWFTGSTMLLGHDSGFRLIPWDHLKNLFFSWNPNINFGQDWTLYKAFLVTQLPEVIFTQLTHSVILGQRITLVFWFFLTGFGTWLGIYLVFSEKQYSFFRIWSSLFAMFNFYILQGWFIAERAKFSLFAALPIAIALLYRTIILKKKIVTHAIAFGFLYFFLNGGGSPPLYGATLIGLLVAFVWFGLLDIRKHGRKGIARIVQVGLTFAGIAIIVNAYWIFPQIGLYLKTYNQAVAENGGIEGLVTWEQIISKNASYFNLLRLQGIPDWYDNPQHPYSHWFLTNPILIGASILPFLLFCSGVILLIWNRKNNEETGGRTFLIFFVLLLVPGVVMAAGSHRPFGFAFIWAMRHIPGFAIFRSGFYKFAPLVWFPIIILSGYALNQFLSFVRRKSIRYIVGSCIVAGLLMYHFPYFTSNIFSFYPPFTTRVNVPSYVINMGSYVNTRTSQSSRILLLPALDPGYYHTKLDSLSWGYFSLDLLPRSILQRSIVANDNGSNQLVDVMYQSVLKDDRKSFEFIALKFGIQYVLWRDDAVYQEQYSDSRSVSVQKNRIISWQYPIVYSSGLWTLYKIPEDKQTPLLFSVPDAIWVKGYFQDYSNALSSVIGSNAGILIDDLGKKNSSSSSSSELIYQARCIFCDPGSRDKSLYGVVVNDLAYAPGSRQFTRFMNNIKIAYSEASNIPSRIDASLAKADAVLAILKWYKDNNQNVPQEYSADSFLSSIHSAYDNVLTLKDQQKTDYTIRLMSFLNAQIAYISANHLNSIDGVDLTDDLRQLQQNIEGTMWITDDLTNLKYDLVIQDTNTFRIHISFEHYTLYVDDKIQTSDIVVLQSGYHKVLLSTPNENKIVPSVFFTSGQMNQVEEKPIEFTRKNPSEYVATFSNNIPLYIIFNQAYDTGWRLAVDGNRISDDLHFMVNGYANGWYIKSVGTHTISVYFEPYWISLIGGILTLLTIIGSSLYIIRLRIKTKK